MQYLSMPQSDSGTVNIGNISDTISQVQDQSTELSSVIAENQGKSVVNEQLTDYDRDDSDKPVAVVPNNDPSKLTVSSNDVGFIIKKVINKEVVTDEERRMFKANRWRVLVNKPLNRYHKLTGKEGDLSCHNTARYHLCSKKRVLEFQNRSTCGSELDIRSLQDAARREAIKNNRKMLMPIIETVLLCARQNISLRGHRDSGRILAAEDPDFNDGNFRALLRLRCRSGDEALQMNLRDGPGNAQYTSPRVQNGILNAALSCLQTELCERINKSVCWSLLCDETTDRLKREQLCITVRYITTSDGEVRVNEDPLCLIDAVTTIEDMLGSASPTDSGPSTATSSTFVRLTGKNLGNLIARKCSSLSLD